ncbi:MAG: hypothetical protein Q9172_005575 [Xanthocarpia lactea]
MAPPAPSRNFEQNSPITTILRQICESYPESSCLRELLQNADDARASEIEYVLDTNTYDDSPLISPKLRAFHGPALLVKNNQVFGDADFASLASIGDSRKRDDPASTGKYGQGFNSCFHWTDGPWILSRQWLLLLDPHREWSTDSGGPTYNILECQDSVEMNNHLKTFQRAEVDTSQAVNATVIRIPLRTEDQAKKSKIVNRQATIKEITKALYDLGQEIREGGMLFLRHVTRVSVKIDSAVLWEACTIGATEEDTKAMQSIPAAFTQMYAGTSSESQPNKISKSFNVNVTYSEGAQSTVHKFLLQHNMSRTSGDDALDTWSRKRKLFPWAAIAAPLDHELSRGQLFSCLRLPIEIGHPVHIHGLFSIVPDRGRLSSSGQTSRDSGSEWNRFMFKTCVVAAWTELLLARRHIAWQQDLFKLWPRVNLSHSTEMWSSLDDHTTDQVITQELSVWNTPSFCVAFGQGFFLQEGEIAGVYREAFRAIQLPLVCLDVPMYQKLLQRASGLSKDVPILSSESLRLFLRNNNRLQQVQKSSSLLLQYCVLDFIDSADEEEKQTKIRDEFRDIRLWPTLQKSLSALKDYPFLLPRDSDELRLFSTSRLCETLDLGHLAKPVAELLERHVAKGSNWVRHRTISDLELDWTRIYSMDPSNLHLEICARNEQNDELLRRIWRWLCERCEEASNSPLLSMHNLDSLFLIPVNGCRIHWMCQLLPDGSAGTSSSHSVLDTKVLPTEAVKMLLSVATQRADLLFATTSDLKGLVAWLVANKDFINGLSDPQKGILTQQLSLLTWQQSTTLESEAKRVLKQRMLQVPIFSRVTATAPYKVSSTRRTSIGTSIRAIRMIEGLPPIPSIQDFVFYDPCDTHETHLLDFFDLLERKPLPEIFFEDLVPHMEETEDPVVAEAKLRLVDFVLESTLRPSDSFKSRFPNFKLVPSSIRSGVNAIHFRYSTTTVDPTSKISGIFFDDEGVLPEPGFLKRHHEKLKMCGILHDLTPAILMERVCTFATSSRDQLQLIVKVKHLLSLPLDANFNLTPTALTQLRTLKWLPVLCSSPGRYQMVSPIDCRADDEKELVDLVLYVFEASVAPQWKALLGWDQVIERATLTEQLNKSLARGSSRRVDRTLAYLSTLGDCSFLSQFPCILSSRGKYLLPENVLLPGTLLSRYPLAPFLDEVESSFARKHPQLLKALGARPNVNFEDLLRVQSMVVASAQSDKLSNDDLNVIVSLLEISTRLPGDSIASSVLMIPDTEGKLRPRAEIVCGERNVSGKIASFSFVNPRISPDLVGQLGLENSFARATRLGIEIDDEDEDEYTPREKLTTTISDTLGRYTVDSTFSELLANANDCGATQISWILDTCANGIHASSALLSEELKELQGSALFVYNNQVFSERDFQGFKEIGQGGKTDDETSTGMFGRGAMTIYHFTDVPMLISGSSFLILDPQQRLLPRNKYWKRKAGVKVSLETALRLFPDQLRPFHGLQGYSMEKTFYDGTLFRLPFRTNEQTLLKETSALIDSTQAEMLLEDYFQTARMSLLFLRTISTVDFRVRGQAAAWSVTASRPVEPVNDIFQDISIRSSHFSGTNHTAIWRVGMTDIEEAPDHLVNPGRRAGKITECGLAACLGRLEKGMEHQIFCTLPTGFKTRLPVSIHASFAITGDRKTIPFEDTKDNSAITKWNQWLLTECIPEFYIGFLDDLAPKLGETSFDFWPTSSTNCLSRPFDGAIHDGFWKHLAREQYESSQLFPRVEVATAQTTPLKTRAVGKARKLFKVTSLKAATFDNLPANLSSKLSALFSKTCSNLVRPPTQLWLDMIKVKIHCKVSMLDSKYICTLFRSEQNCNILEEFLRSLKDDTARDRAIEMVLLVAVPTASPNPLNWKETAHGCRIIPRVDQTLGTVRFQDDGIPWPRQDLLFLPTQVEMELFSHCGNSLIKPTLFEDSAQTDLSSSTATRNPLLELMTETSNLKRIGLMDIESLLVHVESSSAYTGAGEEMDNWITKFWSYLGPRLQIYAQKDASVKDLLKDLKLYDTPIFRYRKGFSWHYITPQQFEEGPYIIAPSDPKERVLCKLLPGVKIVDRNCVAPQLQLKESSLKKPQAFGRLLRVLTTTGASNMPQLSQEDPEYEGIKLLRDLIQAYAKSKHVIQHWTILKSLPIWLQHSPTSHATRAHCIPAEGALMCAHGAMLLPWIRDRDRFVDSQLVWEYLSALRSLDCTIMQIESIWKHLEPTLPPKLTPNQLQTYLPCLEYLIEIDWKPDSKIAPNGYGILCTASSLFDHEEEIFLAAFGESDKKHFLHPDFRHLRGLNLRARSSSGAMDHRYFLQCIASIEDRLKATPTTDQTRGDATKIIQYLRFVRPGFQVWPATAWAAVVQARIYQTSTDVSSEPTYRQTKMLSVASEVRPCSIQHATSRTHLQVMWSQRPLLKDPPDAYVYQSVRPPLLESVFAHLQYLITIRDSVPGQELFQYLKDLQATYAFLQDCPTTESIPGIERAEIWLNLPTTDLASISPAQLQGALRSAKSLCFNAPLDTHAVERAKNFLIPYESLLRRVGCQTMVHPPRPNLASRSNNERPIDQSLRVIRNMQKTDRLTDITFEVEGLKISAHKIFMAAVSEKCQRQFMGEWSGLLGSKPIILIEDMTAKTLERIVAFAYTGEVNWPVLANAEDNDEVADKLDELLDLLRGADRWVMEALHDLTERHLLSTSQVFVRPDNVDDVKEAAAEARAKRLVSFCEHFIRLNAQFVQDCRDMK